MVNIFAGFGDCFKLMDVAFIIPDQDQVVNLQVLPSRVLLCVGSSTHPAPLLVPHSELQKLSRSQQKGRAASKHALDHGRNHPGVPIPRFPVPTCSIELLPIPSQGSTTLTWTQCWLMSYTVPTGKTGG